jgi:hypothetical protein
MLKVIHRINTIEQLQKVPPHYGVEVDLHAYGDKLVVHHDPFEQGVDLEAWLEHYNHAFVVLNIKEEGIEQRVREMVLARDIENFFFLDLSTPFFFKMIGLGEKRVAIRLSEYEAVPPALKLKGQVEWGFIDLFEDKFPLSKEEYNKLKVAGYKLCLVSPELWGRNEDSFKRIRAHLEMHEMEMDAVLTKKPDWW